MSQLATNSAQVFGFRRKKPLQKKGVAGRQPVWGRFQPSLPSRWVRSGTSVTVGSSSAPISNLLVAAEAVNTNVVRVAGFSLVINEIVHRPYEASVRRHLSKVAGVEAIYV